MEGNPLPERERRRGGARKAPHRSGEYVGRAAWGATREDVARPALAVGGAVPLAQAEHVPEPAVCPCCRLPQDGSNPHA